MSKLNRKMIKLNPKRCRNMCVRTHKEVGFCVKCGKNTEVRYFAEKPRPNGPVRYTARCPVCNTEISVKWVERANEEENTRNAKVRHPVQGQQE